VVEHLVLLKLKPTTGRAQAEELLGALRALAGRIPGLLEVACGWNISPARAHGYDLGARMRFADRPALEAYAPHPEHRPVAERVRELCEDVLVVDFEA
jgi:hypothetical protein